MIGTHFIGIGSGKSGSTWLFNNICRHPEIFSKNEKETNYFSRHYRKYDLGWYFNKFSEKGANQISGEFSVEYMSCEGTAQRIKQAFGSDVAILAILRNPIFRVFSDYKHSQRKGDFAIDQPFNEYIGLESNLAVGMYADQLSEFFQAFPESNIKVVLYEDVMNNKHDSLKEIYRWLGVVDIDFCPEGIDSYENKGANYKLLFVENLLTKISRFLHNKGFGNFVETLKVIGIPSLIRKLNFKDDDLGRPDQASIDFLTEYFGPSVVRLEKLLDIKTNWF